ncbi:hypothetical protein B0H14DRAFT_2613881 [Mycena olivaceomarginata]|nr:hypothetical protein B0H14DRAFT_2613881 [Mycena olivaceomarginata]
MTKLKLQSSLSRCALPLSQLIEVFQPFKIDLTGEIPRLRSLVNNTRLPDKTLDPDAGQEKGIELDFLSANYRAIGATNGIEQVKVCILCIKKSEDPNAIPLILLQTDGQRQRQNRIIQRRGPVSSGLCLSSAPPANWTVEYTARIFNTLMTDVLGYSTYAVHGTDWHTLWFLAHSLPPSAEDIAANNITLSDIQKPNDIGLALYDNPVGQLAWIAGKIKTFTIIECLPPQGLTHNADALKTVYTKAPTDAPLLFSQYEYNVGLWPEEYVAKVGNLVSYNVHDFGGHFPGLDNPPALIDDLRDIGLYFEA